MMSEWRVYFLDVGGSHGKGAIRGETMVVVFSLARQISTRREIGEWFFGTLNEGSDGWERQAFIGRRFETAHLSNNNELMGGWMDGWFRLILTGFSQAIL
jgi:hypothetical protein